MKMLTFATVLLAAGVSFAGDFKSDFTTGTAGKVEDEGSRKKEEGGSAERKFPLKPEEMQAAVQKILDDAVKSGAQSACQCCVYIDGKLVVDAWAGTMATNSSEKITGETLFPIFSTEKAQFATAVHIAHERGKFDYEAKVRDYWPEFKGGNKDELTIRQLLGMRTGLPGQPAKELTDEQVCDWNFMVDWCAKSETKYPGRSGYLGKTWGWYLGKVVENVYGRPLNDVLTDEVLKPCGIDHDYYFAVPDSELNRVVTVYNGKENYGYELMNKTCYRKACVPAFAAVANARAIAKFYLRLSGQDGKAPLIKHETLMNALKPNRDANDPLPDAETLAKKWQTVWGLGYTMWGEKDELDRITGSGGLGGSEGFCDLKNRICVGYTCAVSATATGKPWDLRPDIYRAIGIRTRYVNRDQRPRIRPAPRPALLERIRDGVEVYGIVHWGLNTYTDREWGFGDENPQDLNPDAFDAEQIVSACKDGGLQGLIVVAKHHDGFCLWPTKTTEHNISKSPFRGGKGDYVKEMSEACRRYGLKFGIYCSPWDRNHSDYANLKYVETYHAQIKELLSGEYGEVFEMWFDGANGGDGYYGGARETRKIPLDYYRFDEVFKFVRELQPRVCIFNENDGADYRWPGNERGKLSDDSCATIRSYCPSNYTAYCNVGDLESGTTFHPPECDFPLRKGWFYHESETNTVRCGEYLMQRYLDAVGNGGTMNIGIAPDRHGRLAPEDVAALKRFGELKKAFFAQPSADMYNVIVLSEDVAKGEFVNSWKVKTVDHRTLTAGSSLGIKRIRVLSQSVAITDTVIDHTCLEGAVANHSICEKFYYVDPKLLNRVMNATTTNGETDTAQWMTRDKMSHK